MKKKTFFGFVFFVGHVISGVGFWPFWLRLPDPGPTASWKNFAQVLLETRLKSESFEALIGFLAFLVIPQEVN